MRQQGWPRIRGHQSAVKTIADADAGFAHSLMNQANPAAKKATPRAGPPPRHKVMAPASIRDHPAAHIKPDMPGDEAAREKEGASQPSHDRSEPGDHANGQERTTMKTCRLRGPRTMPAIVAPCKRHATRVCTKYPARRCRAWPDVVVGRIIEALGVGSDAQEVDEMDTRSGRLITVVASMLAVGLLVTACAAPPGRGVGSQPASIVLSLANGNDGNEMLFAVRGRRRGGDGRDRHDQVRGRCPSGRTGVRERHHRRCGGRDV